MKFLSIIAFVIVFIFFTLFVFVANEEQDIKIGLLYSKTGTMAPEEDVIAKMVHYAVEQINTKGGILGTKVSILEYDGKSDAKEFQKGAQTLIDQDVKFIFGCWTSASRKAVKPIVEKNDALLFYPVQFEGVEKSDNIIYFGETPNQQINPALTYIQKNFGNKIYVVGSDYIYPRIAELYIQKLSKLIDVDIVGASFIPLGSTDVTTIINDLKTLQPDAVINLLNGSSNLDFFSALNSHGILSKNLPVFSMSVDESSLKRMKEQLGSDILDGHYAVWNYFSSIQTSQNIIFLKDLKKKYGNDFTLTNAGYNIYLALKLWEKGMNLNKKLDYLQLKQELSRNSLHTISGVTYVDRDNFHTHKSMRIAMVDEGEFNVVWNSEVLTHPIPFALFESKEYWVEYQNQLYKKWNNNWQAPLSKESTHE